MATGKIILRPSADVSLEHTIYPDTLSAGYLAINEEVCDTSATYIEVYERKNDTKVSASGTSRFAMTISSLGKIKSVISADFIIYEHTSRYGYCNATVYVEGISYGTTSNIYGNSAYQMTKVALSNEIVNALNNYMSNNGALPHTEIEVYSYDRDESDNSKATNLSAFHRISQMYIELTCEYEPPFFIKDDDIWKSSNKIRRKVSGIWASVGDAEYVSLLKSNIIIDKCKYRGHIEATLAGTLAPTCVATGLANGLYCTYCGQTLKEHDIIPINPNNHTNIVTDKAVTATCTTTGLTQGSHCSACGETLVAQEVIPINPDNHTNVVTDAAKAATCTTTGLTEGSHCADCGRVFVSQEIIPANGHVDSNNDNICDVCGAALCTDDNHIVTITPAVAPTCTTTGLTQGSHCTACGKIIVAQEVVPIDPNAHNYVILENSEECSRCGHVLRRFGVAYNGTATPLGTARNMLAATTVGNYALFGGGEKAYEDGTAAVDAYDTSLTRSVPTSLQERAYDLAATTVGDYALFGGGLQDGDYDKISTVNAYNTSLTRSTLTSLSNARGLLAATSVGNYALFGGGKAFAEVDAYNTSLTKTLTYLSDDKQDLAATTVGNYALFSGGYNGDIGIFKTVDAYDTSLTRSIPADLNSKRNKHAATTVGNYALFGGYYTTVDVYNASLTHSLAPTNLSSENNYMAATTVGNYALFGLANSPYINVYNAALTQTIITLGNPIAEAAATTVGKYALFGGGMTSEYSTIRVDRVGVYINYDM